MWPLTKFFFEAIGTILHEVLRFVRHALYPLRHPVHFLGLVMLCLVLLGIFWAVPHREQIQNTVSKTVDFVSQVKHIGS